MISNSLLISALFWVVSSSSFGNLWGNINKEAITETYFKVENEADPNDYGVDISTPIHHVIHPQTFQGKRYYDMMQGCYDKYGRGSCDGTERARIAMNLDQPAKQHNYTEIGFKKGDVPKAAWDPLKAFWDANKNAAKNEDWPEGNTYVNHWASPSTMVSLEDGALRGSGQMLKMTIWNVLRPLLEEWVGHKLTETSMYGIRVYHDKAVLATHVDRLPLVTSCIINVDQDVNEPWPIEVYGHDGKAYNVTMQPGEMVFYESHTVLHGRPFPMNGSHYANLFIHYSPIDHNEMNDKDFRHPYKTASKLVKVGGHEQSNHGEDELDIHRRAVYEETRDMHSVKDISLHAAAASGDIDLIKSIVEVAPDKAIVNSKDANEWLTHPRGCAGGSH